MDLEEIKDKWEFSYLNDEETDWLIEQATKLEKLKRIGVREFQMWQKEQEEKGIDVDIFAWIRHLVTTKG